MATARRPPPPFRAVAVRRRRVLGARLVRVTVGGARLEGFTVSEPASSIRLLLPDPHGGELVLPWWTGNEFLLPDGRRPLIRTLTPRHLDAERGEMDLDVVVHGHGAASAWAQHVEPGSPVAVSGPGRGHRIDTSAERYVVIGDETAVPAASQILEALPPAMAVSVHLEGEGEAPWLPPHPGADVTWHRRRAAAPIGDALVGALRRAALTPTCHVWAAGEAAAMQRIRRLLFDEHHHPRARATVRGYWKAGASGDGAADATE
jgi:NADPH-dependent ferric siderophore reductase